MAASVKDWRQALPIHVWMFEGNRRNFPGWHFTATRRSCEAVLELLALMRSAPGPAEKELEVTPPNDAILAVPNNWAAGWWAPRALIVRSAKGGAVSPDHWRLSLHGDVLTLVASAEQLAHVQAGVMDVAVGEGDYSIGQGDEQLWFWWYPASKRD
ncbi:MAG TPA: hypothetical protein DFS52_03340 [Myxococcales bacterium]|jgi:hypothetical protein|nr:hypothetical protein [Myxococcales bacterium]